jgi:ABC-2 type transport system permease protein
MRNEILRNIDVLVQSQRYSWKSFLIYRTQSAFIILESTLSALMDFIFVSVVYGVSQGIAGWSYYQLLALIALMWVSGAVAFYLVNPGPLLGALQSGDFDTYLTKPYRPVFLLLVRHSNPWSFFYALPYLALLIFALTHIPVSAASVLLFAVLIVAGLAAFCAVMLFIEVLSYRLFTKAQWLYRLMSFVSTAGQYPLGIYGNFGVFALTVVVPVGLAAFYPANLLFHGLTVVGFLGPLVLAVALTAVSYKLTTLLLKGYTSALG